MFQMSLIMMDEKTLKKTKNAIEKWSYAVNANLKIYVYNNLEEFLLEKKKQFHLILLSNELKEKIMEGVVCENMKDKIEYINQGEICMDSIRLLIADAYKKHMSKDDEFIYYIRPHFKKLPLNKIMYFTSNGRKVTAVCQDRQYEFYDKLDDIEEQISEKCNRFIRTHKSFLVNLDYIKEYYKKEIYLINKTIILIAQSRKIETYQLFKKFNVGL